MDPLVLPVATKRFAGYQGLPAGSSSLSYAQAVGLDSVFTAIDVVIQSPDLSSHFVLSESVPSLTIFGAPINTDQGALWFPWRGLWLAGPSGLLEFTLSSGSGASVAIHGFFCTSLGY